MSDTLLIRDFQTDRQTSNFLPIAFAIIALVFGTATVLATPPFQVTDEFWHFFRAYQISLGHFLAESHGNTQGGMLPFSLLRLANVFGKLPYHPAEKTSFATILSASHIPLDPFQLTFCNFPSAANYSPVAYAPQAIGIALGRACGLSPLGIFYTGREAALLAWTLIGYFTLRFAPALRPALLLLLLMPMSISSACSFSADAMTNASAILFTALIWRCSIPTDESDLGNARINNKTLALICALSIVVTLCKFAYLPLTILVLMIPSSRLGNSKRYGIFISALLAANILISIAWLSMTARTRLQLRPGFPEVDAARQLVFVRSHPVIFIEALANGFAHDSLLLIRSFIGYLGWLDNPASWSFVVIYGIALLAACWPAIKDPIAPSRRQLLITVIAIGLSILIFSLLNYLVWTPVGSTRLEGLQGRYFIPLTAAAMTLLWGVLRRLPDSIPRLPISRPAEVAAAALGLASCVYTLSLIMTRYFH